MKRFLIAALLMAAQILQAKPFVVGDLMGQLGNQMFIIAAATSLALDNNAEPLFPALATETDWNVPLNYRHVFSHLNAENPKGPIDYYYLEPHFHYSPIQYKPNMAIRGWFQSDKYFKHNKDGILNLFAPSVEIMDYLMSKYRFIIEHPLTVAIHYRSYDKEDPEHKYYYKCGLDYYSKAISLFPQDTQFVVFSNDIDWCKKKFAGINRKFIFIEGEAHYHDIYLISLCTHQIICNSSFSWWGAYMNKNPNKIVVVPPYWLNPAYKSDTQDLIPEEWIILK